MAHEADVLVSRASPGGLPITLRVEEVVAHSAWRNARDAILQALPQCRLIVLHGVAGTGKTLLLQDLARALGGGEASVTLHPRGDVALPSPAEQSAMSALLIDEADQIDPAALASLVAPKIVIARLAPLSADAAAIAGAGFAVASVRLEGLAADEIGRFTAERLVRAGFPADTVDVEAMGLLARESGGVPRLVNTLLSAALFFAAGDGVGRVSAEHVTEAIGLRPTAAPGLAEPTLPPPVTPDPTAARMDVLELSRPDRDDSAAVPEPPPTPTADDARGEHEPKAALAPRDVPTARAGTAANDNLTGAALPVPLVADAPLLVVAAASRQEHRIRTAAIAAAALAAAAIAVAVLMFGPSLVPVSGGRAAGGSSTASSPGPVAVERGLVEPVPLIGSAPTPAELPRVAPGGAVAVAAVPHPSGGAAVSAGAAVPAVLQPIPPGAALAAASAAAAARAHPPGTAAAPAELTRVLRDASVAVDAPRVLPGAAAVRAPDPAAAASAAIVHGASAPSMMPEPAPSAAPAALAAPAITAVAAPPAAIVASSPERASVPPAAATPERVLQKTATSVAAAPPRAARRLPPTTRPTAPSDTEVSAAVRRASRSDPEESGAALHEPSTAHDLADVLRRYGGDRPLAPPSPVAAPPTHYVGVVVTGADGVRRFIPVAPSE